MVYTAITYVAHATFMVSLYVLVVSNLDVSLITALSDAIAKIGG